MNERDDEGSGSWRDHQKTQHHNEQNHWDEHVNRYPRRSDSSVLRYSPYGAVTQHSNQFGESGLRTADRMQPWDPWGYHYVIEPQERTTAERPSISYHSGESMDHDGEVQQEPMIHNPSTSGYPAGASYHYLQPSQPQMNRASTAPYRYEGSGCDYSQAQHYPPYSMPSAVDPSMGFSGHPPSPPPPRHGGLRPSSSAYYGTTYYPTHQDATSAGGHFNNPGQYYPPFAAFPPSAYEHHHHPHNFYNSAAYAGYYGASPLPPPTTVSNSSGAGTSAEAPKKKPRKIKFPRPPGKPKRPLSAYNIFFQDERARMIEAKDSNHPGKDGQSIQSDSDGKDSKNNRRTGIAFSDMARSISKKWKALDADTLKAYQDRADEDSLRYNKEMKKFRELKDPLKDEQTSDDGREDSNKHGNEDTKPPATTRNSDTPMEDDSENAEFPP